MLSLFYLRNVAFLNNYITGTIEHAWRNMRRRFKLGVGSVGEQWEALNGALQGDANSVWIINVIISTWANERSENKPEIKIRAYADDTGVIGQGTTTAENDPLSKEIEANDLATQAKNEYDIMHSFASDIGGRVNLKKTHVCGTNRIIRKAVRKTGIPVILHARDLGSHVMVSKAKCRNGSQKTRGCLTMH